MAVEYADATLRWLEEEREFHAVVAVTDEDLELLGDDFDYDQRVFFYFQSWEELESYKSADGGGDFVIVRYERG